MNIRIISIVCSLALTGAGCALRQSHPARPPAPPANSTSPAETQVSTPPAGFETRGALVAACIRAVQNEDVPAFQRTLHPACAAAIDDDNRELVDELYSKVMARRISAEHTVTYRPYEPDDPLIIRGDFAYPVEPTAQVSIRYETTYRVFETVIWALVEDAAHWYLVIPIPSPTLLQRRAAAEAEEQQFRERAREIVAELQDPLRSELSEYIRQGRKHTAARRYRQEFGVDMRDAVLVIEVLEESLPQQPQE